MARSRTEQRGHLPDVIRLERLEEDADRYEQYQQDVALRQREATARFEERIKELEEHLVTQLTVLEEKTQQSKTIAIAILSSVAVSAILLAVNLGVR